MTTNRLAFVLSIALALGAAPHAQAPDRSAPPPAGPTPRLQVPPLLARTLANGLAVRIVEMHEVPVVAVSLVIRSGSAADPDGLSGLASFVSAMLDEGAGDRDSLALADAVDYLGASLGSTSSFDSSAVRLEVPVSRLRDALPIMADVVQRPTFPETELNRIREERLTALLQARDDPATISATAFPRLVYGQAHPYGRSPVGAPDTIRAFTVAALRRFHQTHYRPDNATLLVVGDVSAEAVLPLLEDAFGRWPSPVGARPQTTVPAAPQLTERRVFLIDKPGAAQSQIRIGWVGVARSTPDYFPITVMNTILGGAFTSRLNQNLREEHGYSYGARSGFDMRASAGPFQAAAGVQTDKTAESLTEFFNELEGIRAPVSEDELTKATNYVALGFPSEFETTGDMLRRLEELVVNDLPDEYFASYIPNIQAVSAADVQRVAERYVQPDKMAVVVVGDASVVEGPTRALEIGPMRIVPVEEIMGNP